MRFKKFFKSRAVRVITAVVFILCTLFTAVFPCFAVDLPQLPSVIYKPPQMVENFTYEYGLPISAGSVQDVFTVFWLQNYFGGFNIHHPVAIITLKSGDAYLTYLLCTSNVFDGLVYTGSTVPYYHLTFESGSGTVFYYLLTDYGFVYDHTTNFSSSYTTISEFDVMWYVDYNTSSAELGTVLEDWKFGTRFKGRYDQILDSHPLLQLDSAVNKWIQYYVTATTLYDRQEIYDEAYDIGYDVGYVDGELQGYNDGYDDGYVVGEEEGYKNGKAEVGYFLDIGSIISSIPSSIRSLLENAFSFDLFGINVVGLLLLILGCGIIFIVVKFVWGVFL